jgi:DNA-directed RNA polymerase subunit F
MDDGTPHSHFHFVAVFFCCWTTFPSLYIVLSNAQVSVILQVSANNAVNRDEELNDVYRKTQKYVNRFNSMMNPEKQHQELVDELDNLQECVLD